MPSIHPRFSRYGCAIGSVSIAIAARLLLDPVLGTKYPFATLFLAVLVTAWFGGFMPALTALGIGCLASDYFLLEPRGTLQLASTDEVMGLVLYLVTGFGISLLGGSMHSARRQAETTAELLRRQAALVDQTYDAILVWDWNGPITYWNLGAQRLYGYERSECVGKVSHDLLQTTRTAGVVGDFLGALEAQNKWEGELQYINREGRRIFVESRMVRVHDGDRVYVLEANRDITERKRAEYALRESKDLLETRVLERTAELDQANELLRTSEQRSRLLIEGVTDYAILMLDSQGTILTWTSGAERIEGYAAEEIIGKHYGCLFTPESVTQDEPRRELEKAAAEGRADVAGWRVRKNGSRFWASGTLAALYDEQGKVQGFAKVTRDMTAKRRNDELLRSVLDHTLDGIIGIDERGIVSMINRAGEVLFDRAGEEVLGQNVSMLMPEPYQKEHDSYLANYLRTGDAKVIGVGREVYGLRRDGAVFPIDLAVTEFQLDNERHFVGIVRDISEKRKLEAQLHQSQKMEAFGQLAGGVAHDFNNLLTVISGYSEMMLGMLQPDDDMTPMVHSVHQAGERAAALTRQLLAFSRQQVLEPKVLDVNDVVRDTEKMLRRLIGEDVEFRTHLTQNMGRIRIDPGQIEQVIMNLAVNARDAMPQGGKLTIETREVELDEVYGESHPEARPGFYVMLALSDTGAGMPPEVKSRLFEPFFTTKPVGKGTGLGLAVVHGIIRQSGGSIEVYSEEGFGTTFKIYIPAIQAQSTGVTETGLYVPPRGVETIMLVEDEGDVRDLAEIALKSFGYTVLSASDGKSAVEIMSTHSERVDLLVTDVVMPEMSGRVLAEKLVELYPDLKVLFVSGYTDDAVVRHGVLQANVAFLQKPFTLNAFARKVRDVLDQ